MVRAGAGLVAASPGQPESGLAGRESSRAISAMVCQAEPCPRRPAGAALAGSGRRLGVSVRVLSWAAVTAQMARAAMTSTVCRAIVV